MAKIELKKVVKRFGNVTAVDNISLSIEDGEFMVLLGPSGCGKSTTLRLIAGLEEITEGAIFIGDTLVNHLDPKNRDIAMVFQNYALYPHKNAYMNMAFSLMMRKFPKEEIERRVREAAAILGIEELLDRKPRELSGGQSQRVAMGRAIVRKPKAFLFDEPLSNLDAKLRLSMREEIRGLHDRLKTTTVYVTHDQVEAMTLADRIVVMQQGAVQQLGTPLDIYERPRSTFVAGFIGSPPMNLIDCRLTQNGPNRFIDAGVFKFPLTAIPNGEVITSNLKGDIVILGLRPEDLEEREFSRPLAEAQFINARVTMKEPMGANVHLRLASGTHKIIACVNSGTRAKIGDEIVLACNLSKALLYDKTSGLLLND
jgi:multiple sugar transport system ATP-binding protein